ncbi:MAG: Ig-like domain-containing protein [Burkholderiales bacterium]|nr:Ig-like domain-containing protein [Burkholderiales bacterium]
MLPARLSLSAGGEVRLFALQAPGAVQWTSSDPALASVDAQGQVTAHAAGMVTISATAAAAGGAAAVASQAEVRVFATQAKPASALIEAALAAQRISAAQALSYRVYAQFGDARLPDEFQGAPDAAPDHMLLRRLAAALPTLDAATREALLPFVVPPIYAQSWLARQLGAPATNAQGHSRAQSQSQTQAQTQPRTALKSARLAATTRINCAVAETPAYWKTLDTAHFRIHYLWLGSDATFDGHHLAGAQAVARAAEAVYEAETAFFGRQPLADEAEDCHGGDARLDIYLASLGHPDRAGLTQSYPDRCNAVPSFIALNIHHPALVGAGIGFAGAERDVKAIVAHEFAHVLQLAMDRQGAGCADYEWLDEAVAEWAMDHVDPGADREDGFVKASDERRRSGTFLTQYLVSDHLSSIEKAGPIGEATLNGYADYVFLQFLARKHGPQVIRQVVDGTATLASVEALQAALAPQGGMLAVWPDFALTLWNDHRGQALDDLYRWDGYDWGLAAIYKREAVLLPAYAPGIEHLKTLPVDQAGAPRATFKLLRNAIEPPLTFPRENYEIAPRSLIVEHLRFDDAGVSSVYFANPIAALPERSFIKVQAKKKIGGQWRAVEDWTNEPYKQFCLDQAEERLEELVIIVSNSEVNRGSEQPFRIPKAFPMQIATSNVGCWRWLGTASTVLTVSTPGAQGERTASGTNMLMTVASVAPGRIAFGPVAGRLRGLYNGVSTGCEITLDGAGKELYLGMGAEYLPPSDDGRIEINLDLDFGLGSLGGEPPSRKLVVLDGTTLLTTTRTAVCGPVTVVSVGDESWEWMRVDNAENFAVSADGRTISGRFTASSPNSTINTLWEFRALRQ